MFNKFHVLLFYEVNSRNQFCKVKTQPVQCQYTPPFFLTIMYTMTLNFDLFFPQILLPMTQTEYDVFRIFCLYQEV